MSMPPWYVFPILTFVAILWIAAIVIGRGRKSVREAEEAAGTLKLFGAMRHYGAVAMVCTGVAIIGWLFLDFGWAIAIFFALSLALMAWRVAFDPEARPERKIKKPFVIRGKSEVQSWFALVILIAAINVLFLPLGWWGFGYACLAVLAAIGFCPCSLYLFQVAYNEREERKRNKEYTAKGAWGLGLLGLISGATFVFLLIASIVSSAMPGSWSWWCTWILAILTLMFVGVAHFLEWQKWWIRFLIVPIILLGLSTSTLWWVGSETLTTLNSTDNKETVDYQSILDTVPECSDEDVAASEGDGYSFTSDQAKEIVVVDYLPGDRKALVFILEWLNNDDRNIIEGALIELQELEPDLAIDIETILAQPDPFNSDDCMDRNGLVIIAVMERVLDGKTINDGFYAYLDSKQEEAANN